MHETVSPEAHGLIDYVTVVAFALAPTLFQFDGVPALIAWGLAGAHLVLTLATRFPMGLFDGVPLRAHGVVELVVSVALIVLPWVAGFVQPGAQWFFPVMGVFVFVIWLLSDYGQLRPVGTPPAKHALRRPDESGAVEETASLPGGAPPGTRVPERERNREQRSAGDGSEESMSGGRGAPEGAPRESPRESGPRGDRSPRSPSPEDGPDDAGGAGDGPDAGETTERRPG